MDISPAFFASLNSFSWKPIVNVFNFSNALRIETSENYQNAELSLVSISGKQLVNQQITSTTTVLNTSEIASGIYLLSITSKDKVYTKKVYLK